MEKQNLINHLHRILNTDSLGLSYEQKNAISKAIEIIEKKSEFDPTWIVLILKALGIG